MIVLIIVIVAFAAGTVGFVLEDTSRAVSQWWKSRRKFVCAVCNTKRRARDGYMSLPLDADVSSAAGEPYIVPLNLIACKKCVPFA